MEKYNTAWAMLSVWHTHSCGIQNRIKIINEKCYEYTILATIDIPICQPSQWTGVVSNTITKVKKRGNACIICLGLWCCVPVSGSVARTTTTDVPIPAVSLSPRRLYCDWVKTGDSSFTSSTYTITYNANSQSVWFTTNTCCYTHAHTLYSALPFILELNMTFIARIN